MLSVAVNLFMFGNKIAYTYYLVNNIRYTFQFMKRGAHLLKNKVLS
jgi:hypothetical protein